MTWAIVNNGIVENLIVADEAFALSVGAKKFYEGCEIGEPYKPPHKTTDLELLRQELTDKDLAIIELNQAVTDLELKQMEGTK